MTASDLNEFIGDSGRYQWRIFATLCVINLFSSDSIHIVFTGANMPHWCRVAELNDLPYDVQKNVAIPTQSVNHDGSIEYSSCEMFSLNYSVYNRSEFYSWNRSLMVTNETSVVKCTEWMYDQTQFISTIVSKVKKTLAYTLVSIRLSRYVLDGHFVCLLWTSLMINEPC